MFIMSFMIKASMTPLVPPPSKDRISNPPSLIFSLSVTMPRKKIQQKFGTQKAEKIRDRSANCDIII